MIQKRPRKKRGGIKDYLRFEDCMPYAIERLPDGRCVFLNRHYRVVPGKYTRFYGVLAEDTFQCPGRVLASISLYHRTATQAEREGIIYLYDSSSDMYDATTFTKYLGMLHRLIDIYGAPSIPEIEDYYE